VARVIVRVNRAHVQRVLGAPGGQLSQGMQRLANRVRRRSRVILRTHNRTGTLSNSLFSRVVHRGGVPIGQVGTPLKYGLYLHQGTGIYGPRRRPIRPVRAKVLRFTTRTGQVVFAKSVRGSRPVPFLRNALDVLRS
jgi:hypothetical protein